MSNHRNPKPSTWVASLTALMLVVAACGEAGQAGDTSTTATPAVTTTAAASTTSEAASSGVSTASTPLGDVLVDPDGMTLYVFTPDVDGTSTCYDSCASSWPAVPADVAISPELDPGLFGSSPRTDKTEQLTVGGMPVYLFAGDSAPGDVNGHGVNGVWFAVSSEGEMIADTATGSLDDYGYGS